MDLSRSVSRSLDVRSHQGGKRNAHIDFARDAGDAILAPPGSWLLRPNETADRVRLHVSTTAPRRFVTGMPRVDSDTYESSDFPLDVYSGFGRFEVMTIEPAVEAAVIRNGASLDPALL